MENLTKENFWNQLMEKFPEEMKRFCAWIDDYKKRVDWNNLFEEAAYFKPGQEAYRTPKYHDLPIAMQFGIFLQFRQESLYNEQSEGNRAFREHTMNFITSWFVRNEYRNPSNQRND